ncbi:MAG: YCF48-related protein [Crocinitomicaceae bacterium]
MKNVLLILANLLVACSAFGQTTWYEIPTGTSSRLNAIDFPSNNVGYIVGQDTTILKTTDGGQTWTQLSLNGIGIAALSDDFRDIQFIDENTGFLVAGYSGVYKTIDGAQSWTLVQHNMCFPETVFPFSESDYLIGGGDCFTGAKIDKVVNSVSTPASITADGFWFDYEIVLEMSFSGSNRGLAALRNEYMLRTLDGGLNWDTIPVNVPGAITSVVMVNDTLCYGGYEDPNSQGFGILKSIDGGLTWTQDVNSATFYYPTYLCVEAASNGDIYSGGFSSNSPGGLIFESTNGTSWDYQDVEQPINDMTSCGSDITFGVGDSGYLVVNTPVSELSVDDLQLIDFEVYPNPFQQEFMVNNSANEKLEATLLDASGRSVKTMYLELGDNTVNCEGLKNGMYFLQLIQGDTRIVECIIKQ